MTMSQKKPAKGTPAAAPKPVDLTVSDLPSGNHAYWYRPEELSVRRSRELDVYDVHLVPRLRQLALAQGIIDEEGNDLTDNSADRMPIGLTLAESRAFMEMQDVNAWAYLKGWTLRAEGNVPKQLPQTADDLLNLPRDVYQALIAHSAKIIAGRVDVSPSSKYTAEGGFDDEESPTGA